MEKFPHVSDLQGEPNIRNGLGGTTFSISRSTTSIHGIFVGTQAKTVELMQQSTDDEMKHGFCACSLFAVVDVDEYFFVREESND